MKNMILAFISLIWMPIVSYDPYFFIRTRRGDSDSLYNLYCNYSSEILLCLIVFGVLFSFFRISYLPKKLRAIAAAALVVSVPIQIFYFVALQVQVFGK